MSVLISKEKTMEDVRKNSPLFYSDRNKSNEDYFKDNPLFRAAVFVLVKKAYKKEFASIRNVYSSKIKAAEKKLKNF